MVLDEPTNHLDLWARDGLETALCEFTGTVLFVTHDRYFIDQVSQREVIDGDPGWVDPEDPARAGWALRDDAPILRITGFQHLPLERMGLRPDPARPCPPRRRGR